MPLLWEEVVRFDDETDCWVWGGACADNGYGLLGQGPERRAHRHFYKAFVGPIPEKRQLDHLCRNRRCVNPDHLEAVTQTENVRRGKGTKLTVEIAKAVRASDLSNRALARRYGVSRWAIHNIRHNLTWVEELS